MLKDDALFGLWLVQVTRLIHPLPPSTCHRLCQVSAAAQGFPELGHDEIYSFSGLGISRVPSSFPSPYPQISRQRRCSLDPRFLPFIALPFPSNLVHGDDLRQFSTCRHLPFFSFGRSFVSSIQPTSTAAIFFHSHLSFSSASSASFVLPSLLISLHPLSWFFTRHLCLRSNRSVFFE